MSESRFLSTNEIIKPAAQAPAAGTLTTDIRQIDGAQIIEIWVVVTDESGGGNLAVRVLASIDDENFLDIGGISGITSAGTFKVAFNRDNLALGKSIKLTSLATTGTYTFNATIGIRD